ATRNLSIRAEGAGVIEVLRSTDRRRVESAGVVTWQTFAGEDEGDSPRRHYHALRALDEVVIEPGRGFKKISANAELLEYVVGGAFEHRDGLGNASVVRSGDVFGLSAGTGLEHSVVNASRREPLRILEVQLVPERVATSPRIEQRAFPVAERRGRFRLVAS